MTQILHTKKNHIGNGAAMETLLYLSNKTPMEHFGSCVETNILAHCYIRTRLVSLNLTSVSTKQKNSHNTVNVIQQLVIQGEYVLVSKRSFHPMRLHNDTFPLSSFDRFWSQDSPHRFVKYLENKRNERRNYYCLAYQQSFIKIKATGQKLQTDTISAKWLF